MAGRRADLDERRRKHRAKVAQREREERERKRRDEERRRKRQAAARRPQQAAPLQAREWSREAAERIEVTQWERGVEHTTPVALHRGLRIEVHGVRILGNRTEVDMTCADSGTGGPVRVILPTYNVPAPPADDPIAVAKHVRRCVLHALVHEIDEALEVDGERPWYPHPAGSPDSSNQKQVLREVDALQAETDRQRPIGGADGEDGP